MVRVYPHDPDAYTQGLIFRSGFLFESTGRYGRSTLRKVELETGRVVQQHLLDAAYFAEGLTELNSQLGSVDMALTARLCLRFGQLRATSNVRLFG